MPSNYSLKACEELIKKYVNEYKGQYTTLEEGSLGLGLVLLRDAEGKETIVIQEYFISAWASGHTIRMYNKIPKKYEKMLATI